MILRFEDPAPTQSFNPGGRGNRRVQIAAALRELRQHPGRWAVIAAYPRRSQLGAYSASAAIRGGHTAASSPQGAFEAASRIVGDEVLLYARYLGGAQ